MSKLPSLTGKRMLKFLEKLGFSILRVKGSHHFLRHPDGRTAMVPVHGKDSLGSGLILKILKDVEMDRDDFLRLL